MKNELEFYEERKNWDFSNLNVLTIKVNDWNLYDELCKRVNKKSKVLDLGTGGGENLLNNFPECEEILGTDFSKEMIKTANENLKKYNRKDISFRIMNNLEMDVNDNYYDVVVARNTIIDAKQIYDCLKNDGYILIRGVDKYDCHSLKMIMGGGQAYNDVVPISIVDYENVINAGFKDVELIPICEKEYYKNKESLIKFLKKVPILDEINEKKIDEYIEKNSYDLGILLIRRYYGIIGRK